MKRTLRNRLTAILAVTLCMAFMLTACGSTTSDNTTADNTTADNSNTVAETNKDYETITFPEVFGNITETMVVYHYSYDEITSVTILEPNHHVYNRAHRNGDLEEVPCPVKTLNDLATVNEEDVIAWVYDGIGDQPIILSNGYEGTEVISPTQEYIVRYVSCSDSSNSVVGWERNDTYGVTVGGANIDMKSSTTAEHVIYGETSYTLLKNFEGEKPYGRVFKDNDKTIDKIMVVDTDDSHSITINETKPSESDFQVVNGDHYPLDRNDSEPEPETESEQETEVDWEDVW